MRFSSLCWRQRKKKQATQDETQFQWAVASGAHGLWGRRWARRRGGGGKAGPPKRMGAVRRRGEVPTQPWGASQRRGQSAGAGSQHLPYFCPGGAASGPGGERRRPSAPRRVLPPSPAPSPGRRPKTRRAPLRGSSATPGAGAPRRSARRRRSPRCSSLSAPAAAAAAATLAASSSSASKRRFLQPGTEVLCQESSGRDWLGPCSPGSPAGARAQPFVRGEARGPRPPGGR